MQNPDRYLRNRGAVTAREQEILGASKVCILGCGGLGGFVGELLGRIGVGHLTVVDGDRFDATNLNRQILCTTDSLGCSKVQTFAERMALVNPGISVTPIDAFLNEENAAAILAGHDLVVDCLDAAGPRLPVQRVCKELAIPLVHGAIDGWFAQICTVFPGEDSLCRLYPTGIIPPVRLGNPAPTASLAASLQSGEAIATLLGRPALRKKVLFADMLHQQYDVLPI